MDSKVFKIREARAEDCEPLFELVKGLAEYERLSSEVTATISLFRENGFGENRYFRALLVENRLADEPRYVGFALYFFTFSTFLGKPTLYLEDLFVLPAFRGRGLGKALLKELGRIAIDHQCGRMEWAVLDWNEPAIRFYKRLGAKAMEEWTVYRLTAPDIQKLADH